MVKVVQVFWGQYRKLTCEFKPATAAKPSRDFLVLGCIPEKIATAPPQHRKVEECVFHVCIWVIKNGLLNSEHPSLNAVEPATARWDLLHKGLSPARSRIRRLVACIFLTVMLICVSYTYIFFINVCGKIILAIRSRIRRLVGLELLVK